MKTIKLANDESPNEQQVGIRNADNTGRGPQEPYNGLMEISLEE